MQYYIHVTYIYIYVGSNNNYYVFPTWPSPHILLAGNFVRHRHRRCATIASSRVVV